MNLANIWRRLIQDPPPAFVFEVSPAGIAWARLGKTIENGFRPLPPDVLSVSPVKDNVLKPDVLLTEVQSLAPVNGSPGKGKGAAKKIRPAALILPDYCARVAVLDFDAFPADPSEQLSLVRFRMKKSVPFDVDSAAVGYQVQNAGGNGRKYEVVAAVVAIEIVARYEAPFRSAGFHPGLVTTSMMAALNLAPAGSLAVAAKLSERVLTLAVAESRRLKLLRCVELGEATTEEVMGILFPTLAYAEDELGARPDKLLVTGFGSLGEGIAAECASSLALTVEPLRSRLGAPGASNAGLLGYLESRGA